MEHEAHQGANSQIRWHWKCRLCKAGRKTSKAIAPEGSCEGGSAPHDWVLIKKTDNGVQIWPEEGAQIEDI